MTKTSVLILTFLVTVLTDNVLGVLTVSPRDAQVMAGRTTTLPCSTSNTSLEIYWNYYPVGVNPSSPSSTPTYVYRYGALTHRFRARFQVERNNATGSTNLVITQANASDAGTYLCQDNGGTGETGRAQLIVLEPKSICKVNAKPNAETDDGCGNDPQELELHCSVSFAGNSRPSLEWRKLGETTAIREGTRTDNSSANSISLILTLKVELNMNRASYICLATILQASRAASSAAVPSPAAAAQYNCSSDGIQITCHGVAETNSEECRFKSSCKPRIDVPTFAKGPTSMTVTSGSTEFPLIPVVIALVIALLIGALAVALIIIWQRHTAQIKAMVGNAEQLAFRRPPERIFYREDPIAIHTIRLVHADERQQRRIRGVTALGREVFVVSSRCPEILVYDSSDFTQRRRFDLPGLVDAWDVVSCPTKNHLFVMDAKEADSDKEIIRFEPSGDVKSFWSTKGKAGYLSVSRDGNVLLAVYKKNTVIEYDPEGKLIRKVEITSVAGDIHPHHAFKLDTGHLMVIHGIGDDCLHRACIVNGDGMLVKSFGGKKGLGEGQMNLPKYLAVDGAGSVMVLDQNNNRVLLLGFDLQHQRELLTGRHGLDSPCKIHLNELSGRLYVAQFDSILIFDILQKSAVMPIL